MPKVFGKNVSPIVLYGAVAICGVLVYNAAFPAEESVAAPIRAKKKTTTKKANDIYLPEDYEAKFTSFAEPVKNAFRPLIAKRENTTVPNPVIPTGPEITGILPINLTGGEGNWAYTGYAEVDGIRQGLLENTATGESVFLRPGQRWKQLVVRSVAEDNMAVAGPDGTAIRIPVKDPTAEQNRGTNVVPPTGTVPVNPAGALRGPIGGAVAGTVPGAPGAPNATATDLQVQPDESMQNDRDARRRNRRNRRQGME